MALPSLRNLGVETQNPAILPQTGPFSLGAMGTPQPPPKTLTMGRMQPPMGQRSVAFGPETEDRPSINPLAIARDIQTGIARSGAAIGLTLANKPELPEYHKGTIERKTKDFLFGEEAVKSLATRIAEGEQKAQQFGLGKTSLPGAGILIGGLVGLDFTGVGGPKKVGEQLLRETGEEAISTLLKKIRTVDELIPKFSKIFSRANTPETVSEGLSLLSKESEALNTARQALKTAPGEAIGREAKGFIPASDLVKKTVKDEGGWKTIIEQKSTGKEIVDIGSSPAYGKQILKEGYIPIRKAGEAIVPKVESLVGRYKTADDFENAVYGGKYSEAELKQMGFEVLSPGRIKSPKGMELPDFYNQATSKANPLAQEARKFKSAEEFVKGFRKDDFQARARAGQELVDDLKGSGVRKSINPDGTITIFHGTSKTNAQKILQGGEINEGTFFSPAKSGTKFGDSPLDVVKRKFGKEGEVIEIRIDPRDIETAAAGSELFASKKLVRGEDGIWRAVERQREREVSQLTDFYNQAVKGVSEVSEEVSKTTAKLPKEGLVKQLPKQELRAEDIFPQLGVKETLPPSIPPTPPKSIGEDIKEGVDWLINTIKTSARPSRKELERLKSEELSKRAGAVAGIFKKGEGLPGFFKALGKLKGELAPKTFKVDKIAEEQISKLMRAAQLNPKLDIFERLNAQTALLKTLNGIIPTNSELRLLEDTFGPKLVDAILESRTLGEKLLGGFQEAINLPRTVMSSFDLSAPFRQGLMLLSHPKAFGSSFMQMFKMFGSDKAFKAVMETIAKMPEYELMKAGKLAITDVGRFMGTREESFAASWAEKIPVLKYGVRASNRSYTGFLNKLRADVFSDIIRGARNAGKDVGKNSSLIKEIASFVNAASGRGGLGAIERAAPVLNGLFFSPRLMASRIYFMNPVNYVTADPIIRKEMLKSVFTVVGSGLTVLGIAQAAGLKIGDEPRSSDWGKIILGKTRVDIWGGFQQYARMIAQLITGEYVSSVSGKKMTLGEGYKPLTRFDILLRQIESKEAPVASFVTALLKQQDFQGKPVSIPDEVGKRFVPMVLGDIYELAKENPNLLPVELLGIFGFGLQTYESKPAAGTGKGIPGLPKSPLKTKSNTLTPLKGIGL